ncbi:hypothetical protein [Pseudomonas sp. 2FE]|uniref:hypothetical protein n=1 Tax=Pseudomonas sp. 2FE TaxID=2502190 RepID=UPI0010F7B1C9|nr:hypothetical protein [Pseudomonas sp. 2FE]
MNTLCLHITLVTVLLWGGGTASAAPLLTASCGKLDGTLLVASGDKPTVSPQSHSGNPILFIDSENPKKLVSHWKIKLFEKKSTTTYEAFIVEHSPTQLHAVEQDGNGLYAYTLFLDTGVLFYSHHRLQNIFGEGPSLLSLVGHCTVKVSQ